MTSQSTDTHIAALEAAGELRLFSPHMRPDQAYRRRLWLTQPVWDWVQFRQGATRREREHRADTRAFLKRFVMGADFDNDVQVKLLRPHAQNVYSFRVLFNPQHRIIGGFLRHGEFVATAHRLRSDLRTETWVPTLRVAKSEWSRLFPNHPRSSSDRQTNLADFGP